MDADEELVEGWAEERGFDLDGLVAVALKYRDLWLVVGWAAELGAKQALADLHEDRAELFRYTLGCARRRAQLAEAERFEAQKRWLSKSFEVERERRLVSLLLRGEDQVGLLQWREFAIHALGLPEVGSEYVSDLELTKALKDKLDAKEE